MTVDDFIDTVRARLPGWSIAWPAVTAKGFVAQVTRATENGVTEEIHVAVDLRYEQPVWWVVRSLRAGNLDGCGTTLGLALHELRACLDELVALREAL